MWAKEGVELRSTALPEVSRMTKSMALVGLAETAVNQIVALDSVGLDTSIWQLRTHRRL